MLYLRHGWRRRNTMLLRSFALVVLALIISLPVGILSRAEAIIIGSQGTAASPGADGGIESNSMSVPTIQVAPNPFWAPAEPGSSWVSFTQSGNPASPGFVVVANNTVVTFRESFVLAPAGGNYTGNLIVFADDSTSVIVDGVLRMAEASTVGNTYAICSDFGIGCRVETRGVIPLSLAPGPHTFEFAVAQRNLSSFGLDYAANLIAVPEPGTTLLLSTGLIGLGTALRRRVSRND
jgi:hypothetical protein